MTRAQHKLSAAKVARLTKPGRYGDGAGLWLQVAAGGSRSWLFRFMRDGKAREMGLGPLQAVTLAEARERAREARRQLVDGIDPIEARDAARKAALIEAASTVTFREAAERYIAANETGWKNAKHRAQWRSTLDRYAYPVIGALPVAAVDTGLVLKVIEPIWATKPETAGRVRGRIESVLDWCTVRGHRHGDNPARWRGHLAKILPARKKTATVRHHPAMPYTDLPAFMADLRERDSVSAWALEWTVLTAARTSETTGARISEIDVAARVWNVPGERMKSGRPHRVPLCDRALEIFAAVPRDGAGDGYLFPGAKRGRPLSNMAMLELLRGMTGGAFTVHGFRSSFRDWAAEATSYPAEVAEMALAHRIGDETERAYRRGDVLAKRRKLMDAWSAFCNSPRTAGADVVPIKCKGSRKAVAS